MELQHLQGETRVKEVKGKKQRKVVKSQEGGVSLVIDKDMGVNQILNFGRKDFGREIHGLEHEFGMAWKLNSIYVGSHSW